MSSNKNKGNTRNKILGVIIIILGLLFFSVVSAIASLFIIYKNSIHSGIFIENVDIGGLTVIEANNRVEVNLKDTLNNDKLILKYNGSSWEFNSEELGLKYDFLKAVNDAYLIGRRGTYLDRIETMIALLKRPYNVSLKTSIDMEKINSILNKIQNAVNIPGLDAEIRREDGKFIIEEERLGLRLNKEKDAKKISEALLNSGFYDSVTIDLTLEPVVPKYRAENLSHIGDLLGSYTTKFNTKLKGRSTNVNIASRAIDRTVLLPNEIFSFNGTVGPRTIKNGYQIAQIILRGKLVDGIGGGICQVSSTLYNSALMSELGIVERANHTIPSTYVPMGLDATVSYGVLDFKFQNTLDFPIYIESIVSGNKMKVNIYGKKLSDRRIKLTSNIDEIIKKDTSVVFDDDMFKGQKVVEEKGRDGYKVSSYMTIYDGDRFIERRLISKDYYRPRKEIIKKGTKKPPKERKDNENGQNERDVNN